MPSLINLWFVCNSLSIYKLSILYCTIRLFKKDNYDNGDALRLFAARPGRRGRGYSTVLRISTKAREPADWAGRAAAPIAAGPEIVVADRTARTLTHHLQRKSYSNGYWTTTRAPSGCNVNRMRQRAAPAPTRGPTETRPTVLITRRNPSPASGLAATEAKAETATTVRKEAAWRAAAGTCPAAPPARTRPRPCAGCAS